MSANPTPNFDTRGVGSDPITPLDSIVDREMAEIELDQRRMCVIPLALYWLFFMAWFAWVVWP